MNTIKASVKRYALPVFFTIAFAIAIPAFAMNTAQAPVAMQLIILILGSYAPMIAALIVLVLSEDKEDAQALRGRIWNWRLGLQWYLLALLLPTGIWLVSSVISTAFETTRTVQLSQLAFLPIIFVTNFGEEIGWRGFALPRLLSKLRPIPASLLLGLIWGIFHVPLYWGRPTYMALNFALTLVLSIILSWLFLNTSGSLPLCTLFHAVFNTWGQAYLSAEGAEGIMGVSIALLWVFASFLILRYGTGLVRVSLANKG